MNESNVLTRRWQVIRTKTVPPLTSHTVQLRRQLAAKSNLENLVSARLGKSAETRLNLTDINMSQPQPKPPIMPCGVCIPHIWAIKQRRCAVKIPAALVPLARHFTRLHAEARSHANA